MGGAKELGDHEVHLGPGLPGHLVQAKKPLAAWTKQVPDPKLFPVESHRSGPGMDGSHLTEPLECAARTVCVTSPQVSLRYLNSPWTCEQNPNS